jgi:hypothetical protein
VSDLLPKLKRSLHSLLFKKEIEIVLQKEFFVSLQCGVCLFTFIKDAKESV